MAPVRRYLRITKYSVLECRIYLDNPSLAQSWLLNPRSPVLPRVIESIRPLVLPKLREDKERSRKKGSKKKNIKDVVVQDDFEVSMFLTETSTRHSLLTKKKLFLDKAPPMMQSNSTKLIDETNIVPVDVDAGRDVAVLRQEHSDDDDNDNDVRLSEVPVFGAQAQSKRHRNSIDSRPSIENSEEDAQGRDAVEIDSDADEQPPSKRARYPDARGENDVEEDDDKKKLAMDVSYEGFAIYGRVLCLVVRKPENKTPRARQDGTNKRGGGQASMENWITSTQIPVDEDVS
ncbi:uncharacterized protein MAM_05261 [Metarhizium album ARSEF 1941]|uniref:Uncharacterized protein n=1 Tax=Metarhizium album (strain ARSEF 1941) TaxID=1081103 RepID=A0A0B2WUS8_METAS|nr:uncharacterized protein MAM_05261 [Metarhizium album ARSEF 1941]KHN96705.1 hypothetical protein MAM_05261 [Metarhizium album ARSEF 1941]